MNYRLNRNISYILPIIDLIKMKEKIQIAKMRAVLLYIMQSFPHGVEFIKLFKILYFAQQDHLLKYGKVLIEDSFKALPCSYLHLQGTTNSRENAAGG